MENGLALIAAALDSSVAWGPSGQARLLMVRGLLYIMECNYTPAVIAYQQSLHFAQQPSPSYSAAWAENGLGSAAIDRNQLDVAEAHFLAVLDKYMESNYRVAAFTIFELITIYATQDRLEKIEPYLAKLAAYGHVTANAFLIEEAAALDARLALARGDLGPALRWARSTARETMYTLVDCAPYIQAEVLLAGGSPGDLQAADQLLRKLHDYNERNHDLHGLVSVLVSQTLVWSRLGQREQALTALEEAVQLAVPSGLIHPFIRQGAPMTHLLVELGKAPRHAYHVETLLAAFPPGVLEDVPEPQRASLAAELVESLSKREQAVLTLMARSLTNQEIADELVVSVHTVRNHTVSIYNKLEVADRRQAVAKARRLGLIPRH